MKLLNALLVGLASASCPNDGWTKGAGNKCIPKGVAITCSATKMKVEYNLNHVYKEWSKDSGDGGSFTSAATVAPGGNLCERTTKVKDSASTGKETLEFDLGKCGVMTQSGGKIIYTVTISGSSDGSHSSEKLGGVKLYTTQDLSFTAECKYDDHQEVHKNMVVGTMTVDPEKQSNTGKFLFDMRAYRKDMLVDPTNKPKLGDRVKFEIKPHAKLPPNLKYFLGGCFFKNSGSNVYVMKDGFCAAKVLNVEVEANGKKVDANGMKLQESVSLSLDAFHTSNAGGNIELFCELKMCKDDGGIPVSELVDPKCSPMAKSSATCGAEYAWKGPAPTVVAVTYKCPEAFPFPHLGGMKCCKTDPAKTQGVCPNGPTAYQNCPHIPNKCNSKYVAPLPPPPSPRCPSNYPFKHKGGVKCCKYDSIQTAKTGGFCMTGINCPHNPDLCEDYVAPATPPASSVKRCPKDHPFKHKTGVKCCKYDSIQTAKTGGFCMTGINCPHNPDLCEDYKP